MKDKCPKCGQIGIIVLEPPRKKHETKRPKRRSRTVLRGLGDWKNTEYRTDRKPGRYFRVHHYLTDKNGHYVRGKTGRPKSKFCYIGNFELAIKKLENLKNVLDENPPTSEELKKNHYLVGDSDLKYMRDTCNQGKKIDIENLKHDDIDLIYSIILDSNLWFIRNDRVFSKYR